MNSVKYDNKSPYVSTTQTTKYVQYLDFWTQITIPASSDDVLYSIETKYNNRPDLLSFELYGTPQLWWVFAVRNPDIIIDPIFDFKSGVVIYAPTTNRLGVYL